MVSHHFSVSLTFSCIFFQEWRLHSFYLLKIQYSSMDKSDGPNQRIWLPLVDASRQCIVIFPLKQWFLTFDIFGIFAAIMKLQSCLLSKFFINIIGGGSDKINYFYINNNNVNCSPRGPLILHSKCSVSNIYT